MQNLKVDFTISTGKQYENVHVSAEADTEKTLSEFLNASLKIGKTAEETFHNCFIKDEVAEKAKVADTGKDETLEF